MRHAKNRKHGCKVKAFLFFFVLFFLMVVSFLLPLRPKESLMEGRDLTKFPEFSAEALFCGEFFHGIDDWFSDTMPGRDRFLEFNRKLQKLYGVRTIEVVGSVGAGDEIPDTPFTGE